MNAYEKLVKLLMKPSKENAIRIGTYKDGKISIGELVLDRDDYIISEHLITGYQKNEIDRVGPVKNGDRILVLKISDELYAAVERMIAQ